MVRVRGPVLVGTTGFFGLLAVSQPVTTLKENTHTKEVGKMDLLQ